MWPWEHVAVAYLAYSLYARAVYRRPPRGDAAIVLVLAAMAPDLIDKPLAWGVDVLPSGRSLAHSLFVAIPTIGLSARLAGRRLGVAVAFGYLWHLAGDVVYPVALGDPPSLYFLFWPVIDQPAMDTAGLFVRSRYLLGDFLAFLATTRGRVYAVFEGLLLGTALVCWLVDGRPGPATIRAWLRPAREEPQRS